MKDKVNNHYMEIFGASIALGVIAGASQISKGARLQHLGRADLHQRRCSQRVAVGNNDSRQIHVIPPTITIREGHRVKVYFTQDMLLPAYENHRIAQSFKEDSMTYVKSFAVVATLALAGCKSREQKTADLSDEYQRRMISTRRIARRTRTCQRNRCRVSEQLSPQPKSATTARTRGSSKRTARIARN